jgi:hypothetical protein
MQPFSQGSFASILPELDVLSTTSLERNLDRLYLSLQYIETCRQRGLKRYSSLASNRRKAQQSSMFSRCREHLHPKGLLQILSEVLFILS